MGARETPEDNDIEDDRVLALEGSPVHAESNLIRDGPAGLEYERRSLTKSLAQCQIPHHHDT